MRPRLLSNFKSLKKTCEDQADFDFVEIADRSSPLELVRQSSSQDIIVLDNSYAHLTLLCLLRWLLPWWKPRLVYADYILYRPMSWRTRLLARVRSLLLRKVDLFAMVFLDSSGYRKYYGLDPKKMRYVPFKVNGWERGLSTFWASPSEGSYVLCAGRTHRDHKTFLEAMRLSGLPGVLLLPADTPTANNPETEASIPSNVRLEVHSDGEEETFLNWIKEAAIVVIPRFSTAISSNGISVYLMSMAAWRCVILTKGPGAEDLLQNEEAILVDAENPEKLAQAIRIAWNDVDLRQRIATNGRRYAERMQGAQRYMRDLYDISVASFQRSPQKEDREGIHS